ncbi:MAG: site-2 protease family protein [Oscillospiraceae bacterium]|nr:site-2 protease family protein [Oscillospiraceae bacterium]
MIPSLLCITLHELAHGLMAYRLGDDTAKRAGRLTLNPLKHLDPIGLLMMLTVRFGWAKPVPVNMYRFRNPKRGMALTALAGPGCNLLITVLFLFLYGLLYSALKASELGGILLELIEITAYMSLGLCIFNLLPVPPLDGSKVLLSVLPDDAYRKLMYYERYGSIVLLALVWSGVLGRPLGKAIGSLYELLFAVAQAGFHLVNG